MSSRSFEAAGGASLGRALPSVVGVLVVGGLAIALLARGALGDRPGPADRAVVASSTVTRAVEIRVYNLEPGSRAEFHRLVVEEGLPLLDRWHVDVVAYGPSLHDEDSYFLIRAFDSLEERQKVEDEFYGSREWREGPRKTVLALIESYATVVVELDEATIDGLRRAAGY